MISGLGRIFLNHLQPDALGRAAIQLDDETRRLPIDLHDRRVVVCAQSPHFQSRVWGIGHWVLASLPVIQAVLYSRTRIGTLARIEAKSAPSAGKYANQTNLIFIKSILPPLKHLVKEKV